MIKVAALTSGTWCPSARFRVRQHLERLHTLGVLVDEFVPAIDRYARLPGWPKAIRQTYAIPFFLLWQGAKLATRLPGILGSWTHQVTWLQRAMLPGLPSLESCIKSPIVLDVDDAVWLELPWGALALQRMARRAAVVLAGNAYIADWLSSYCRDVRIVPTAVDTEQFRPPNAQPTAPFTIGWTGTSSNLVYLQMIEKPLRRFLRAHRDSRLLIVADQPPNFGLANPEQICFVPWSEKAEVEAVQTMDVGLMPLPDDAWTRGKCSFKMLQYMACGLPVVVSPVGMNTEVLSMAEIGFPAAQEADWYDALRLIYRNRDQAREYGRQGRRVVQRHFSSRIISCHLAEIFQDLGGSSPQSERFSTISTDPYEAPRDASDPDHRHAPFRHVAPREDPE